MEITEIKFNKYESVRKSGKVNMLRVNSVCKLSGLLYEECIEIMKNYSFYKLKYIDKVVK